MSKRSKTVRIYKNKLQNHATYKLWILSHYFHQCREAHVFTRVHQSCFLTKEWGMSALKIKVILPPKWVNLGIAEEMQFETWKLWQTIGNSRNEGEGLAFVEERKRLGGRVWREVWRRRIQACGYFSLAEMWQFLIGWPGLRFSAFSDFVPQYQKGPFFVVTSHSGEKVPRLETV